MDGDFSMSGVGTITWRKGNRLLGFGPLYAGGQSISRWLVLVYTIRSAEPFVQAFKCWTDKVVVKIA